MKKIDFDMFIRLYDEAKSYNNLDMYIMERGWQEWMDDLEPGTVAEVLKYIYSIAKDGFLELLNHYETLRKVSDRFGIPYSTLQRWKSGITDVPEYTLLMMAYITIINQ
uniref:Clp gene regulator n=1 Tax=Myoviridae sp. ct4tH12 TaxID=2825031 RepID=A0A8S5PZ22_9CAUD|nr:MAG TPA: clp gene regulator [Myoviridae sp. ct4tH12]